MIQHIGNFKVLEKIGQGGFGTVYKVENSIGKFSALKILSGRVSDPKKEVKVHANLSHTNIVDIFNYHPELRAIEMEYLSGGSLADLIKKGPIDHKRTIHITREILRALEYAHQEGYMHCDVKPSNILLDSEGKIKLSDFGLAKLVEDEIEALPPEVKSSRLMNTIDTNETNYSQEYGMDKILDRSRIKGTLPYMAPEQKERKPCQQSDIYAVGLILYEMLISRLPTEMFPELPSNINRTIPKRLDKICMKALRSVHERYKDANDMIRDLEQRKRSRLFTGLKIALKTTVIGSITSLLIGATAFYVGGEELPELRMSVENNETVHAVKVLISSIKGDPAKYIKRKFNELETLVEDKEILAKNYEKALEKHKELQRDHKLQKIDYDREIKKVKTLQKELEELGTKNTTERTQLQEEITATEDCLKRQKITISNLQKRTEKLSEKLDAFYSINHMGPYFRRGINKADVERFFGEETKKIIRAYIADTSNEDYRIFKIEDDLKIFFDSGKAILIKTPKDFDKSLKRILDRMDAINQDTEAYLKKHGSITIKSTDQDIYAEIHRTIYKGTTLAKATAERARDLQRVIEERLSTEDIQRRIYCITRGDEIIIGK